MNVDPLAALVLVSPSQLSARLARLGRRAARIGRHARRRVLFCWVGGVGLVVFGLLPTSIYLANILETRFPQPALPDRVDGIVLLAGAEKPTSSEAYGEPQVGDHGGRYMTALRLAERYPDARIVFSGGPRTEPGKGALETQAAVAEASSVPWDSIRARLTFDERSRDTCASAANTYGTCATAARRSLGCRDFGDAHAPNGGVLPGRRLARNHSATGGLRLRPGRWNAGSFQIA